MSALQSLLDYRKHLKRRKPDFIRQDAHKRPALGRKWRRPRGIQSKMRKNKRGYRASVSTGYSSPRAVHGLHPSGLRGVVVHTLRELQALDPKTQGATIAHVGLKRRIELLQHAVDKKIPVLNIKDAAAFLKKTDEERKQKREVQATKLQQKQKKHEELKKTAKAKEEKQGTADLAPEEKKKEAIKEMEKVLTKPE